jgi:hypothetical protein
MARARKEASTAVQIPNSWFCSDAFEIGSKLGNAARFEQNVYRVWGIQLMRDLATKLMCYIPGYSNTA